MKSSLKVASGKCMGRGKWPQKRKFLFHPSEMYKFSQIGNGEKIAPLVTHP
jgi:hypothetical protein